MPASPSFPLDDAQLASVITEGIFFGLYLSTFFSCVHVLFSKNGHLKSCREIHHHMVFAAMWMFFFATLDLACGIRLNMRVFLVLRGDTARNFADLSYWVNVLKLVTFVAQVFMGDCILLYRCWIVYNKQFWIILIPALMTLAETTCGLFAIYLEITYQNKGALTTSPKIAPYLSTTIALTVAMNVIITSLIITRIWLILANLRELSPERTKSPLYDAIRILLDSGLIYTTTAVILLGTYVTSNNAAYLVSDCMIQTIGITFNLIIIRVGRGTATVPPQETQATVPLRFATFDGSSQV